MIDLWAIGCVIAGAIAALLGAAALSRRARESRWGALEAIDAGRPVTLSSERLALVGRPDVVRRSADGRRIPIELKHRSAPERGPFPSHRVQVGVYCLLIEEEDGRPPPYGIVRYTDREWIVPWDRAARAEVIALVRAARAPYDGRATPSPARCRSCRWADGCDVRAPIPA